MKTCQKTLESIVFITGGWILCVGVYGSTGKKGCLNNTRIFTIVSIFLKLSETVNFAFKLIRSSQYRFCRIFRHIENVSNENTVKIMANAVNDVVLVDFHIRKIA